MFFPVCFNDEMKGILCYGVIVLVTFSYFGVTWFENCSVSSNVMKKTMSGCDSEGCSCLS